ncbi:hypothetical protein G8759_25150 [Spirosoma aureum]|uniref:Uncharacterized protein n=1 Tax=Spirosoma aureum TaxID=2692134 RepID=A0A6G9ATL0_9BACT|nr:hypothetical protein [Spirosoma aureum]QIP15684.1 hypothetical protein G8759_25150 [Spirosoma aureum]
MKKNWKWFIAISIAFCVISYASYYILWGIGMGTIHSPNLTAKEQTFINEFERLHPQIDFYFSHHFDIKRLPEKNASAEIILEPLSLAGEFKKWPKDSLLAFSDQINDNFQRALNYKQAYDSLHIFLLNYENRITYKELSYPIKWP